MSKTISIIQNVGSYLRPVEKPVTVPVLETFSSCGLTFAIHYTLGDDKRFTCTEVSTGYALGHSNCVAGNGIPIPAGRKAFVAYCKENIPLTEWLHDAVEGVFLGRVVW